MSNNNHPVSPHLQIYRLPLTAVLSITHRITGVLLAIGCLLLVGLLAAAAQGADAYQALIVHFQAWYGQVFMLGLVFSLYLHFFNGIRHLFWDMGLGFERPTIRASGLAVVAFAVLATLIYVFVGMLG